MDSEGGMDLQQLLAAAQQMQDHLMSAQQELAETQVAGTSGGGLVTARVNGQSYDQLRWPLREVGALLEAKAFHPGR